MDFVDVVYRFQSSIPYSLHDGRVNRMVWENGDLRLFFEDGYLELSQPPRPVEGQVRIQQVDEDFSYVHFLSDYGRFGSFQGEKMPLSEFIRRYPEFSFEIVGEYYSYQSLVYGGYLSLPERESVVDMTLSITYTGAIVYERAE